MRQCFLYIILYCNIVSLAGCAGLSAKMPEATSTSNSAVAITVDINSITTILNVEKVNPRTVLFVELDSMDDSPKKSSYFGSNYVTESFLVGMQMGNTDVFLLDIEPGIYAAVGMVGVGANTGSKFYIYFPSELILSSITEVGPDTMGYMGEYRLKRVSGMRQMDNSDEFQTYFNTIQIFDTSNQIIERAPRFAQQYMGSHFHSPKLHESKTGKETEIKFLRSKIGKFKNTAWENKIRNSLSNIN